MKKPNITNGKWVYENNRIKAEYLFGNKEIIAEVFVDSAKNKDTSDGKAISAVPDMIDALIKTRRLIKAYFDFSKEPLPEFKGEMETWGKALDDIEASLLKAGCE